jgi:beta-glucosidase
MVTDKGDIIVAEGAYTLSIGGGQPATDAPSASGSFKIAGQIMLPE